MTSHKVRPLGDGFRYHGQESHDNASLFRARMRKRMRDAAMQGRLTVAVPPIVVDVIAPANIWPLRKRLP